MADTIKNIGEFVASGAGGVTEWFMERTTASLTWILWKFLCTLLMFVMAGMVLVMTLLGYT